jgi:hypothetical protein
MSLKNERKRRILAMRRAEEAALAGIAGVQEPGNTEFWYPNADDLQLPDVPEHVRPDARRCLAPILRELNRYLSEKGRGVRGECCWETAFLMSLLSAHVGPTTLDHVEGVWTRALDNTWRTPDDAIRPAPHAWNSLEGHIVDITAEFYGWNSNGEDAKWLHEPLKVYSPEEIYLQALNSNWDCVSSDIWLASGGRETVPEEIRKHLPTRATRKDVKSGDAVHQRAFEFVNDVVFKPASERLLARLNSAVKEAA